MRIAEIFRSLQGEGRLTGVESIFVRASGCNLRCRFCDTPYASWTPEGDDLSVDEILDRVQTLRQGPHPAFLAPHFSRGCHCWLVQQCDGDLQRKGDSPASAHVVQRGTSGPLSLRERVRVRGNCEPSSHHPQYPPGDSHPHFLPQDQEETIQREPSGISPPEPSASEPSVRHIVLTGGEPMLFAELIPLTARLRQSGWHITIETSGTLDLPVACDLMSISPKLSNSAPPPETDPRWTWRHNLARHAPEVMRRLLADYDYQLKFVVDRPEDCDEVESYLRDFTDLDRSRVMLMPQGTDADHLAGTSQWLERYCHQHALTFCPRRQIEWFGAARGR